MKPYKLTIAYEVVEFFRQQSRWDRKILEGAFIALREFPHTNQKLVERGPSGRDFFVYLKDKFAIKYWIDEREREVKIIDLKLREPRQ